jgi:CRP-like cAMP-binding protein
MAIENLSKLSPAQPEVRCFQPNDKIPLQSNALWKIEQGVVRTLSWDLDGKQIILGFWCVGDVVGQPLSRLYPYEIECLTKVDARLLSTSRWAQSLEGVFLHLQQVEELQCILRSNSVLERLKNFLRWLARKFGYEIDQGWLIELRLTHQDISEVIGTSRVKVTRLLNLLQQDKEIIRNHGRLILLKDSQISWIE